MKNYVSNADILGRMGEKIIANYLNSKGHSVEESIDHYDYEKDLLVDGKKVEVKTEAPFVMQNAFSVRENQLKKCRNVDILYFVSVPPSIKPNYKWAGWIFEVDPKTFKHRTYTTKTGLKMILIDIEQDAVKAVHKMKDSEINQLSRYTSSNYNSSK